MGEGWLGARDASEPGELEHLQVPLARRHSWQQSGSRSPSIGDWPAARYVLSGSLETPQGNGDDGSRTHDLRIANGEFRGSGEGDMGGQKGP